MNLDAEERITLVQEVVVNKNPFDIERFSLLSQLRNMSLHLFGIAKERELLPSDEPIIEQIDQLSKTEIRKHSVPISQMGNFEQVLSKKQTLRDPLADSTTQQHHFGSPFQKRKRRKSRDIRASTPTNDALKDSDGVNISMNEAQVPHGASDEIDQKFVGDEMDIVVMERQQLNHQEEIAHMYEAVPVPVEPVPIVPKVPEEDEEKKEQEKKKKEKIAKLHEDRVKCIREMVSIEGGEVIRAFTLMPERVLQSIYQRTTEIKVPRQQMVQLHKMVRTKRAALGKRKREEEEQEEIAAVLSQLAEMEFLNPNVEKTYLNQLISTARDFRKKLLADKLKEYLQGKNL
jgi:hypothetical protein